MTITLKGIVPVSTFDLFVGGGGGYYYAMYKNRFEASNTAVGVFDGTATGFGYHIVGGVDMNVSNSLAIGVEIKHIFVNPEFDFSGFKERIHLDGTIANASLKYKFN